MKTRNGVNPDPTSHTGNFFRQVALPVLTQWCTQTAWSLTRSNTQTTFYTDGMTDRMTERNQKQYKPIHYVWLVMICG